MTTPEVQSMFKANPLFAELSTDQVDRLAERMSEVTWYQSGEYLMREGEVADEFFLIEQGHVEVLVTDVEAGQVHPVATLKPGDCVGEMALIDAGTRTASARAVDLVGVRVVNVDDLVVKDTTELSATDALRVHLAQTLAERTRSSNEAAARNLTDMVAEAERRVAMSQFMARILVGVCLYTFAIGAILGFGGSLQDNQISVIPLLAVFVVALYLNIRTSVFPASDYGFNLHDAPRAMFEGTLIAAAAIVLALAGKWAGTSYFDIWPQQPLFNPVEPSGSSVVIIFFYVCFALIQELIARSGMQSSFAIFLTGPGKTPISIVLAALLMSSTYMLVSLPLAALVFPFALALGWLYARHPTLAGVIWSHLVTAILLNFVIGLPF